MARGFYWSILFMLAVPYLTVGGFLAACYLSYRKWRMRGGSAPQADSQPE